MGDSTLQNASKLPEHRRGQGRVFAGLFVGYCLLAGSRAGVTVAAAEMMSPTAAGGFGLDKQHIGMIQSAFTMTYGPSKFFGSVVSDIVSPRILFTVAVLAAGVSNFAFSASDSFGLFVAAWALNGVVQGLGWPAVSAVLVRWFPKHQLGRVWGLVTMAGNIGQSLSPVLLSYSSLRWGWKSAFTAPAALAMFVAPVAWGLVRDQPPTAQSPESKRLSAATEPEPQTQTLSTIEAVKKYVLPSVPFWLLCTVSALAYLLLKGLANWSINFLSEVRGFTTLEAATAATMFEVGGIAGSLGAGALSDILSGRRNLTSLIFTCLTLPGLVALWCTPASGPNGADWITLAVGCGSLFGLGFAANGPKTMAGIAARESVPKEAGGSAGGVLGLAGQVGASLAGFPLISLQNSFGWSGVFWGLGACALLAIAILIPLSFTNKTNAATSEKKDL